jgi:hypothetical protein
MPKHVRKKPEFPPLATDGWPSRDAVSVGAYGNTLCLTLDELHDRSALRAMEIEEDELPFYHLLLDAWHKLSAERLPRMHRVVFTFRINDYDVVSVKVARRGPQTINAIRVVREVTGLDLKTARAFVKDGQPRSMPRHQAEAVGRSLMSLGATVEVR